MLNAGAAPPIGPLHEQTWQTFSRNLEVDTQQAFHWCQAALRLPLPGDSTVVTVSSGAALGGSPLSGGYAGAKAAVRFISAYAGEESRRAALGIRFVAVLPQLTPETALGRSGAEAYAARQGIDLAGFVDNLQPVPAPQAPRRRPTSLDGRGWKRSPHRPPRQSPTLLGRGRPFRRQVHSHQRRLRTPGPSDATYGGWLPQATKTPLRLHQTAM